MTIKSNAIDIDFDSLPTSSFWSETPHKEIKMHKIHAYPAKFPSLVVQRSIQYARENGRDIQTIADVFCGCGTTALEAKLNSINFWGCDINPVATLIAKAKSHSYKENLLISYFEKILNDFNRDIKQDTKLTESERIVYWFESPQRKDLYALLIAIRKNVPKGKYRDFFLCAFSNILKGCSKWLTKSIKPQVDPNKIPADVLDSFKKQVIYMINANSEAKKISFLKKDVSIMHANFIKYNAKSPFVDMVITSPPYATSYEYADLHQLSALWLGYTRDYRKLRNGTIGSLYHNDLTLEELETLNDIGTEIYHSLLKVQTRKARSVAKYFLDMNKTVINVKKMLTVKGHAIFIVGNTEYKGVKVDNAKFLTQSLIDSGFNDVQVFKRKIGFKNLTPYRSKDGKFSSNSLDRRVYDYEFVLLAKAN